MPNEVIERIQGMTSDEIEKRLKDIDGEVEASTDPEEVNMRTLEVRELNARKEELADLERRQKEAREIAKGKLKTETIEERKNDMAEEKIYNAGSPEYRRAWLKSVAVNERGEHFLGEMTPEERTAFTFTTQNTGAVVPTEMQNRIADLVKSDAPMIEDATLTNIEKAFSIPVRKTITQGDAAVVGQGAANDDEEDSFDLVTMTGVDIKKHAIMTRRMEFQSIDAFETWLVNDISKRIAVAEERVAHARLSGTAPATGEAVNNSVKIAAANVLTAQAYSDAVLRNIMSLIDENGEVVIYANSKTIWNGLAGIVDADNKKVMIPNAMVDPVVQGRIYGATVKKDSNLADNVAYFGVKGALKANKFGPMEVYPTREAKTANMIYTGAEIFDTGLENPCAFVKVTFTAPAN